MNNKQESSGQASVSEVKREEGMTFSQLIYDWLGTLLLVGVLVLLFMTFFIRQVNVKGDSMNNTLQDKDRLLVYSFFYTPQQGDIVIVNHGKLDVNDPVQEPIIKRVIAVEGQTVEILPQTGQVMVDGRILEESYVTGPTTLRGGSAIENPVTVPKGYVYVMGDNRGNSMDSRNKKVGLVPLENIVGKAIFRVQPMNSFGKIE